MKSVLLAIHPDHAENILNGTKTIELRKIVWIDKSVDRVVLYATSPIQRIVGEFKIKKINSYNLNETDIECAWQELKEFICVKKPAFRKYLSADRVQGYKEGRLHYFPAKSKFYAIRIGQVTRYDNPFKIPVEINTPQNFNYYDYN